MLQYLAETFHLRDVKAVGVSSGAICIGFLANLARCESREDVRSHMKRVYWERMEVLFCCPPVTLT
jgi:hypothetical protein